MPRTSDARLLLLDTHIWLWLAAGTTPLAPGAREAIGVAAAHGNVTIAAISVWEVAMLARRNRIVLGEPAIVWLRRALAAPGLSLQPVSVEIAVESCELPAGFRSDPADELLVATARVTGATLLTRDRRLLDYAAAGHLEAMPA